MTTAGRDVSASLVLIGLREQSPKDAEINLQLARLTSRRDDVEAAVRCYHMALYGLPVPVYHALLVQDNIHLPSAMARGVDGGWTAAGLRPT